jgi:L-2-hydroxyglutarate oxidase
VHGEVEAGPNAVLAFAREGYRLGRIDAGEMASTLAFRGFWAMAARNWRTGARELLRSLSKSAFTRALQRLVPEIREEDLVPGGSGVRAQAVDLDGSLVDDFRIVASPGAVHVLNAPSPAATASLAIGREVARQAMEAFSLSKSRSHRRESFMIPRN